MSTRQYVGARYVPKFADPISWNKEYSYEALTIVTHLNNSYTSKKAVPPNTDINNEAYWVLTGNFNSQVEEYRKATEILSENVEEYRKATEMFSENFIVLSSNGGNGDGVTDNTTAINSLITSIGSKQDSIWITKGSYLISGSVTIPSNINLHFDGGELIIANTGNLTINGQIISPLYKIFDVEGNLGINKDKNTTGYPEWFDNNVNLALKYFKCVELQSKDYIVNDNLIINDNNITLRGVAYSTFFGNSGGSRLLLNGNCRIIVGNVSDNDIIKFARNITLENFEIAQTNNTQDYALSVYGVVYGRFKNLTVSVGGGNKYGVYCTKNVSTIYESCRVQTVNNTTTFAGFYLTDSGNPVAAGGNASIYFNNCTVSSSTSETGTSFGWLLNGACSDTFLNGCETSETSYGFAIEGTAVVNGANDILMNNCVFDACTTHCISISNITVNGAICISNSYMTKDATHNINQSCLYLENCKASVSISNTQIISLNNANIGLQINGNSTLTGYGIIANGMNTPFLNSGTTNTVYCQYMHDGTLTTVSS